MALRSSTDFGLTLGQRITKYRKLRGWSQTEAAEFMGVQRTSLNRWEKGKEVPCGENMTKLRDHLSMPIGTNEELALAQDVYQMLLPFDQPVDLELRITPNDAGSVRLEIRRRSAS